MAQQTAPVASAPAGAAPLAPGTAAAIDPNAKQLQGVEAALAAAKQKQAALAAAAAALAKETADLQASLVQRAAAIQAAERELSQIEATLATLEEARRAKALELADKRRALLGSLAALERLAMTPPGAALVDEDPLDIARGSLLLRYAVPELQRRAGLLAGEIAQMDALGREIEGRRAHAQSVEASLQQDGQQVAELLKRKADLQRQTAAEASAAQTRSEKLAAQAKDLRDLLDKLASRKTTNPGHIEARQCQTFSDPAGEPFSAGFRPACRPVWRARSRSGINGQGHPAADPSRRHCRGPLRRPGPVPRTVPKLRGNLDNPT